MHLPRRAWRPLALLSITGSLLSCGGDGPTEPPPDPVATKLAFVTAPPASAGVGDPLNPQPVIQLQDATGKAVAKAGVVVTAVLEGGSVPGGSTATTGANGRATFSGLTVSAPAGAHVLHFDAPSLAGLVHTMTVRAGSSIALVANSATTQTATAGLAVPLPPSVKVSDAAGNPASGVAVTFSITSGVGSVVDAVQQTGADGIATVGSWVLGLGPGTNRLQAAASGLGQSVNFTATGILVGQATAAPTEIQVGLVGTSAMAVPVVSVIESGAAKQNALVQFMVAKGGGTVELAEVRTDAAGEASVGSWILGPTAGENVLEARVPGYSATPLRFRAWGVAQLPASLEIHAGDGQTADALTELPVPVAVRAHDAGGAPLVGLPVNFSFDATIDGAISGTSPVTDGDGVARIGAWRLPAPNGEYNLLASAPALENSPVRFTATVFDDTPHTITPVSTGITAAVGQGVSTLPRVRVLTIGSDRLAGVSVEFAVATGDGSLTGSTQLTDANGEASPSSWTLGTVAGQQSVTATAGEAGSVTIHATATPGPPAAAVVVQGDLQSGPVYNPLPVDPTIRIVDQYGNATPGKRAIFAVTQGGGQLFQGTQISNSEGEVSARWRLGGTSGSNQITVTFPSEPIASMGFSATATAVSSGFDIEVMYLGTPTPAEQEAVDAAVARWRTIIQGDVPSQPVALAAATCTVDQPAINQTVDDLLILVDFSTIDGSGGVLGSAGPCVLRGSTRIPAFGTITIDGADAADLASSGELRDVMLHEVGHVLGFGTIWGFKNLLVGEGGSNPQYTGIAARQAYNGLGGTLLYVPVENTGGSGTADSHWRESAFSNELMTGFIGGNNNPLSKITSRSLIDLGYVIDDATADPLGFTPALRAQAARGQVPLRRLRERPLTGPIILIYPDGTTRKVPR